MLPGQHVVLRQPASPIAERVQPHTDPIREMLGEPAPGQSALDKKRMAEYCAGVNRHMVEAVLKVEQKKARQ